MGLFNKEEKKKQAQDMWAKSMIDLIGYKACDEKGILTKPDGTYARFLRVESTDLFNIDLDGLMSWINAFTVSERTYTDDHKIFAITARVDTSANQMYWQKLKQQVGNSPQEEKRMKLIVENQQKSAQIEKDTQDYMERVYAILIFGETKKQLRQHTTNMILSNGNIYSMRTMSKVETEELLKRQFNMNSR